MATLVSSPLEPLVEAAQKLLDVDLNHAIELAQSIHQKAFEASWAPGEAQALLIIGTAEYRKGNLNAALHSLLQAQAGFASLNQSQGQLEALTHVGRIYRDQGNFQQANQTLVKALELAQRSQQPESQADIYNLQASIFNALGEFAQSLQVLNQALELVQSLGFKQREANVLNNLGILLTSLGDYPRALEYLTKAYQLSRDLNASSSSQALILGSIGILYRETGEYPKALHYYQQVLELGYGAADLRIQALALNNLGNLQYGLHNLPEAREYFEKALNLSRKLGLKPFEIDNLDGLGQVQAALEDYPAALQSHELALQIAREIQDIDGEMDALLNLGRDYLHHSPNWALKPLHEGLELAQQARRNKSVFEAHLLLADVYEKLGQPNQALAHHREFHRVERGLFNEQSQRKSQVLSIQFEIEQNRRETELLRIRIEAAQTAQSEAEARVAERTRELEQAQLEIVMRLAIAAEYRDDKTGEHTWRVGRNAGLIAQELGLPETDVSSIRSAARLHDVGKIGIPDSILLKPGRLTLEEVEEMRKHTHIGARILSGGHSSLLRLSEQIALSHHERWDGNGYPYGLSGDNIPIAGRIVAVADVFDALTHERPYKRAWSVGEALAEIERQSGSQFDPQVVQACLKVFNNLDNSYEQEVLLDDLDTTLMVNVRLEQAQLQMAERDIAGIKEHFEELIVERTRELETARRHAISLARRMELMAHTDVLSGLANRRAFEADLETELTQVQRQEQALSVLTLDLDNLKYLNDSEGHERGDEMLRQFGEVIHSTLHSLGKVYRVGGDEFAAILPKLGTASFDMVFQQVELAVKTMRERGFTHFNASAGLAAYPLEAQTEGDLVRLSDQRMYQQKIKRRKSYAPIPNA